MGSLAVSRLAVDDDLPSASIADQVALIARKSLAPQALAIDEGTVYPDELLRRLGDVGAWGSHQPENGAADLALRHSIDRSPRRSLWCDRLHGVVPEHAGLVRLEFKQPKTSRKNTPTSLRRERFSAAPGSPTR
jgi:hypothetical protein